MEKEDWRAIRVKPEEKDDMIYEILWARVDELCPSYKCRLDWIQEQRKRLTFDKTRREVSEIYDEVFKDIDPRIPARQLFSIPDRKAEIRYLISMVDALSNSNDEEPVLTPPEEKARRKKIGKSKLKKSGNKKALNNSERGIKWRAKHNPKKTSEEKEEKKRINKLARLAKKAAYKRKMRFEKKMLAADAKEK